MSGVQEAATRGQAGEDAEPQGAGVLTDPLSGVESAHGLHRREVKTAFFLRRKRQVILRRKEVYGKQNPAPALRSREVGQ